MLKLSFITEQGRQNPLEARAAGIAAFFDKESKKISDRTERARSLAIGVDTNGAVKRRQQQILHLEQRQIELNHARAFVLGVLSNTPQASETPSVGYYFVEKLNEIDLEIERIQSYPRGVIIELGVVKGKRQELEHLSTIRADMLRVGNHVLGLLGEPPLVDEKNPAANS